MRRKKFGFTLVEIMVSVFLASFIFGVVLFLYLGSQRSFDSGRIYSDIYADARLALDWMSRDIKGASEIVSAADSSLVLKISSIYADDIIPGKYDQLTYSIYQPTASDIPLLKRTMDADANSSRYIPGDNPKTTTIANNISSLIFTSAGTYVTIELTASRTRLNRTYQETLNSVVKLRNK